MDELTDALVRARDGDAAAAEWFVRATQAEVWRLCRHLGPTGHADDLTQDTYARAFGSLQRFAGRSSARTWLLAIARRACVDAVRLAVRERANTEYGETDLDQIGLAGRSTGRDPGDTVPWAMLLHTLPERYREAFVLTQVLGLSYPEVADVCVVGRSAPCAHGWRGLGRCCSTLSPRRTSRPAAERQSRRQAAEPAGFALIGRAASSSCTFLVT